MVRGTRTLRDAVAVTDEPVFAFGVTMGKIDKALTMGEMGKAETSEYRSIENELRFRKAQVAAALRAFQDYKAP
jgi:hypothetical protein